MQLGEPEPNIQSMGCSIEKEQVGRTASISTECTQNSTSKTQRQGQASENLALITFSLLRVTYIYYLLLICHPVKAVIGLGWGWGRGLRTGGVEGGRG